MSAPAPLSLAGKRALVTGAGQRVGQAIALALGARGMHVAVHYRESRAGAERTAEQVRASGGQAVLLAADLSSRAQARALVDQAVAALGGLDLVVASAASFEKVALADVDDAAWDRSLDLNLASPFALVHQAVPALKQARGSVVFITCSSATVPMRGYLPYVVSKGALKHLMKTLALELAPEIRVNAVAPGTVMPPPSYDQQAVERLARAIPLSRVGTPEDIASAVVFLASSPFVTGHELAVDGGRSVARSEHFRSEPRRGYARAGMPHREERSYSIEVNLVAEFDDSYEGDEDGFAWFERFEGGLKPALIAAVHSALRADPRFALLAAPRGKDPDRTLELELRFKAR